MNITKNKKNIAIIVICTCVVFLLIFFTQSLFYKEKITLDKYKKIEKEKEIKKHRELDYDISLKDRKELHLKYAKKNGLKKMFKSDDDFLAVADSLRNKGSLVYVSDKRNYLIKRLTHSHPYLTRDARDLLNEIGSRFCKKEIEQGLKPYKIIGTSLLRTQQSQCDLRNCNKNATIELSAHLYGTTFDVSSQRFLKRDFFGRESFCYQLEYKRILEEVLQELRFEGRCVVIREYKQSCFHITVVK